MENAIVRGGFLQRQGKVISTEKVLPKIIIEGGIGEVDIGPDDEAFALGVR